MLDFGPGQGRSDFATAGVAGLRRGLQRARTPARAEIGNLHPLTLNPVRRETAQPNYSDINKGGPTNAPFEKRIRR